MINEKIQKQFTGKKALVTGGTGLIGRQVVDILVHAGARVKIVSLDKLTVNDHAEHIVGDLMNFEFCRSIMRDVDYVFHLAGVQGTVQTSSSRMASHFVPTLMMNTNVLEAARLAGIEKLAYTSSIGAYADGEFLTEADYRIETAPMAFAGWAKRMAELQIHAYKVQYNMTGYATVRLANIYGPGDNFDPATAMVIPALISRIHSGEKPLTVWGDGSAVRDFLFSRDAAEGVILALYHGTDPGFVNIGSGTGHSIRDVVNSLRSFIEFEHVFDASKPSGAPRRVMDITRARTELHFAPTTSLVDGLRETWNWYLRHSDEYKKKMNYYQV